MDRVVIDKGIAGLGNRLRCVTATVEYAQKTGRKVYIDWTDGMFAPEGENAFNIYFSLVDVDHVTEFDKLSVSSFYPAVYAKIPMKGSIYNFFEKVQIKNRYLRKVMHYCFKIARKVEKIVPNDSMDKALSKMSHSYQMFQLLPVYQREFEDKGEFEFGAHLPRKIEADAVIYCDNIPFYSPNIMQRTLALQPWIQKEIDDFVHDNKLDVNTVGIHVRASGKECYGDLEKFIKKLEIFIADKGIERLFICTDNAEVEKQFRAIFSDKVVTYPKYLPPIREGETGIHDFAQNSNDENLKRTFTKEAVIDMFALSKTTYLFYQFGSTFSEISKVYHKDKSKCQSWMAL